jgi:hypothetical protein
MDRCDGSRRGWDSAAIVSCCGSDSRHSTQEGLDKWQDMVLRLRSANRGLPGLAFAHVVHAGSTMAN